MENKEAANTFINYLFFMSHVRNSEELSTEFVGDEMYNSKLVTFK